MTGDLRAPGALATVLRVCVGGGLVAVVVFTLLGMPLIGVAPAAGLLIGSLNGFLAFRSLASEASFRLSSLFRLAVLSAAGIGAGLLLGTDMVYLTVGGLAVAQLVLAAVAVREVVR